MDEDDFLPTTAYAVLGLLSLGQELSGYELRQWALTSLRFFYWSPAQSHVYRELRRLEALGHVTSRDVPQSGRPDKRVFAITTDGRQELTRWLDTAPVAVPVLKLDSALRVFFGHAASPGRLDEVLDEHRRHVQQLIDELGDVRDALSAMAAAGGDETHRWERADAVAAWGEDLWRGDLAAVKRLRKRLHET